MPGPSYEPWWQGHDERAPGQAEGARLLCHVHFACLLSFWWGEESDHGRLGR
jgi:hypothetical protein